MWIHPEPKTGVLFSTNINNHTSPNSENHLRFGVTSNLATYFDYFEGNTEIQERVTSLSYLVAQDWSMATLSFAWSGSHTIGTLYINLLSEGEHIFDRIFYDLPAYTHLLGAEVNTLSKDETIRASLYNGFIYSF